VTAAVARSTLNPEPQSLALPALMALMLHVVVASTIACASFLFEPAPHKLLDDHAMQVSMMVLPKSKTLMAERAQHAPVTTGEQPKAEEQAPVRESDLTYETDKAKVTKGQTKDHSKDREAAMRQLLMEQMLEDTPEGKVDRTASDPNSDATEAINATGLGSQADPEYARYVSQLEKLFNSNFHPLPAIVQANPDLVCTVHVDVDDAGNVTHYDVQTSNNASFDHSAEAAVQAVQQIPLPPERFRSLMAGGYTIHLRAKK
jgi:hypothetical protein